MISFYNPGQMFIKQYSGLNDADTGVGVDTTEIFEMTSWQHFFFTSRFFSHLRDM